MHEFIYYICIIINNKKPNVKNLKIYYKLINILINYHYCHSYQKQEIV